MFALEDARQVEAQVEDAVVDLRRVPDERLSTEIVDIERRIRRLQAARLRRIAELDRRKRVRGEGRVATASWLARTLGVSFTSANDDVRVGRALEEMPATSAALARGEMSAAAARVLAVAHQEQPDAFERSEMSLVAVAKTAPAADLASEVRRWVESVDPHGTADRAARLWRRRRLRIAEQPDGMVRVEGELDPETGETVRTALRAIQDADVRATAGDVRSNEQRTADSLGEMARQWMDSSTRPRVARERPHVTVTIALEALRNPHGRVATLAHAGAAPASFARRLACDAAVIPAVLGSRSEPLDVGRKTPVVPPAIRRAVVLRDGHCRFPGCDRPEAWCDAHHVVHWADGGATSAANLLLLCRAHHRAVHEGFAVRMTRSGPVFHGPEGVPIEEPEGRGPP
jgi:hypothetical protein